MELKNHPRTPPPSDDGRSPIFGGIYLHKKGRYPPAAAQHQIFEMDVPSRQQQQLPLVPSTFHTNLSLYYGHGKLIYIYMRLNPFQSIGLYNPFLITLAVHFVFQTPCTWLHPLHVSFFTPTPQIVPINRLLIYYLYQIYMMNS